MLVFGSETLLYLRHLPTFVPPVTCGKVSHTANLSEFCQLIHFNLPQSTVHLHEKHGLHIRRRNLQHIKNLTYPVNVNIVKLRYIVTYIYVCAQRQRRSSRVSLYHYFTPTEANFFGAHDTPGFPLWEGLPYPAPTKCASTPLLGPMQAIHHAPSEVMVPHLCPRRNKLLASPLR